MSKILRVTLIIIVSFMAIWVAPHPAASAQNTTPWHKGRFYLFAFHGYTFFNGQYHTQSGWYLGSTIPMTMETVTRGWVQTQPLTPGVRVQQTVQKMLPLQEQVRDSDFTSPILNFDFLVDGKLIGQAAWDNDQPGCDGLNKSTWSLWREGSFTEVKLGVTRNGSIFATVNNGPIKEIDNRVFRGMASGDIRIYPSPTADLGFPCSTVWWNLPKNQAEPVVERFTINNGWALLFGDEFLTDGVPLEHHRVVVQLDGMPEHVVMPHMLHPFRNGSWGYHYINFAWPWNTSPWPHQGTLTIHAGERSHTVRILVVNGLVTIIR